MVIVMGLYGTVVVYVNNSFERLILNSIISGTRGLISVYLK